MLQALLKYYAEIRRWERFGIDQTRLAQVAKFRALFEHARAHSRFYRELYGDHGLGELVITSMHDIERVPVVDKAMLRSARLEDLLTVSPSHPQLRFDVTSGSTGEPLRVYLTRDEQLSGHVRVFRGLRRWGYTPFQRIVVIHRHLVDAPLAVERDLGLLPRLQRGLGVFRRQLVSIHEPIDEIVEQLRAAAPDVVWSTPSMLLLAAQRLEESGETLDIPLMISMSETLFDEQKARLQRRVARNVVGHYGMMESPTIAIETPRCTRKAVFAESFLVESVNERSEGAGRIGTLVVSNLIHRAMPILRYMTGDLAEVLDEPGFPNRVLGRVLGRTDDILTLGDGSQLAHHHASSMFVGFEAAAQWKIVRMPAGIEFHVKPAPNHLDRMPELRDSALAIWAARFPHEPLKVVFTDDFGIDPRTGKSRMLEDRSGH